MTIHQTFAPETGMNEADKINLKPVNLALQGGGAHGAFAWGVLDKLLEDGRIGIEAISATSAGAMNAVVCAYGISLGGAEAAREKLEEFWREVSQTGKFYSPSLASPWEKILQLYGCHAELSPTYIAFQAMTQLFSPYQLNPFNINPLRDVLNKVVDFERIRECELATRLFLSATNVRTGKIRVFENSEISTDVVMASACLPQVFQAVEIEGEPYWDGGFMGNPAIFPLIYKGQSRDVIIVHISPIERSKLPTTAAEILDRMNEISFNSSLMREMRAIAFVTDLIDRGSLAAVEHPRMRIHSIRDDAEMSQLGIATKLNPDWDFLLGLKAAGRQRAETWLAENYQCIGVESSIDLADEYL